MSNNAAYNAVAFSNPLEAAFPCYLKAEAAAVADLVGPTRIATHRGMQVRVDAESLEIPYRLHHGGDETLFVRLNRIQQNIYSCVLTRHHDGFVRHRQLERLVHVHESWVMPFVLQLASEYVAEILTAIETNMSFIDAGMCAAFIRNNPDFYRVARARMISYWNCYYRRRFSDPCDYVGFRVFAKFDELSGTC